MIGLEYFYKQLAYDSVAYLPLAVYRACTVFVFRSWKIRRAGAPRILSGTVKHRRFVGEWPLRLDSPRLTLHGLQRICHVSLRISWRAAPQTVAGGRPNGTARVGDAEYPNACLRRWHGTSPPLVTATERRIGSSLTIVRPRSRMLLNQG